MWLITLLVTAAWLYLAFGHGQFWKIAPLLKTSASHAPLPSLCIIVPARNEADTLPKTLPALLQQNYPGQLQIVLVDDNSTDGTATLARNLAALSSIPCHVVNAAPLEPGWTGKLWALEQGLRFTQSATFGALPDFYLLTDADILHPSQSAQTLAQQAQTHCLEMASLMVKLRTQSFWEKLLIPAFVFFFQKLYPFSRVNNQNYKTAGAAGGCILIRRTILEKTNGLFPIRANLIDDCSLAKQIKKAGGKIWLGLTDELFSLRSYEDLAPIWKMVSRTAYTQLNYSILILIGAILGMSWLYLWAPTLMVWGLLNNHPAAMLWGLSIWAFMSLLYWPTITFYNLRFYYALCLPAIALLYSGMTLHSAILHWRGRGGQWKERSYSAI